VDRESGRFARANEPRVGDLICVRFGKVPHHVGVMISERQFVHALFRHHVVVANLDEFRKRLEMVYRPLASVEAGALQHVRD
jgi:cell wall-associated NlpC family hydrolase